MRLISDEEEQLGIMGLQKALEMAASEGLDLVEVAPKAQPPVCRIMDFGKLLYRQKKERQKQKSQQKRHETKGIRIGLRTGDHDLDVKVKRAREFLDEGHSLKVSLIFRGREVTHYELGFEKMIRVRDSLKDIAKIDQEPKRQGNSIHMILSPSKSHPSSHEEKNA